MRKNEGAELLNEKFVIVFLAVILAGIVAHKAIFSPRSVTFECHPERILANSSSPIVVRVVALNRLGFRVPFEHLDGNFAIQEGAEKINIVSKNNDHLIFKTAGRTGRLVIMYFTRVVPFPVEIILNIESAALADNGCHEHGAPLVHELIFSPLAFSMKAGG